MNWAISIWFTVAVALAQGYRKPPQAVVDVLTAKPTPAVQVSPAKTHLLLLDTVRNPSIADLARPMLRLAGLRIDPVSNGPHLTSYATGAAFLNIQTRATTRVTLPANVRLFDPAWSPDGTMVAVANQTGTQTELWVVNVATGAARKLPVSLNAVMGNPVDWMPDNKMLLVTMVPSGRGPAPAAPVTPPGPKIQESTGKAGPTRTYQDMLSSPYDEQVFEYCATSQPALVDVASGRVTPVGKAGIHGSLAPAPSGKAFLITTYQRPFSYLLPVQLFGRTTEVWTTSGDVAFTVAKLPMADRVPIEGVPTGPRMIQWRPTEPQTLVWTEAMDGGNPKEKVPHRDRILMQRVPTRMAPMEIAKVEHRLQGAGFTSPAMTWLEDGRLLITDYERLSRRTRTFLLKPESNEAPKLVASRNAQDRYRDPGAPVSKVLTSGGRVVGVSNDAVLLRGDGASPRGDFPFVDRLNLTTGKAERLFQSDPEKYQEFVAMLDDGRMIIRSESPVEPPNYFLRSASGEMTALTSFPDPTPQLRKIQKQLVTYRRADGVPLSFTLYLPPDYQPGKRLPTVVWAYPREYNDADTASQINGSLKRFNTLTGYSHLFFLLAGYAVLDNAAMPVVGDPETVNNTYVEQIVSSAKAAIDKAVDMGVTDRDRVGVGGHSYGAFMTANLLAHSDLFRAGIARSGAYNRTLTPFGFQSERRTFWEATDVYMKMSPFWYADKIKEPILLIHGEADNNQGTFPIQSDRMYQAIRGNGGTVRLVFLPFESHGYSAQESIEHVLAEQIAWFDQHVKNAPSLTSARE